jgi:endonuclease YncB( thermonuclease family)
MTVWKPNTIRFLERGQTMDGAVDLKLSDGEKPQKQIQALIRAEIARHHPIKGALRPLEIIAECSVRAVDNGGRARYEIIDEHGVVRAGLECGRPLTIADLVAELRNKHPSLFEVASAQAASAEDAEPSPAAKVLVEAPRDWLILSSNEPREAESAREGHREGPRLTRPWYDGAMSSLAARVAPVASGAAAWARGLRSPAPLSLAQLTSGLPSVRPLYAFAAISVAFALVILAFLAGRVTTTHEAASDRSAPVAAAPIAQAPATTGTAAPGAAKPREKPLVALVGAPDVIDTSTLRIEGNLIRLFGVEWARGGQSDDLVRYLRGRAVTCRPTDAGDVYRCDVDGRDLSQVVLYNGGGRATDDAPPELLAAENHAKTERLGVWRKQALAN